MRSCLILCLIALLPELAPAEDKRKKGEDPIKAVELKRKDPVSYEKDIEPIFYNKCISCHSGNIKESKLDLSSYETLIKGGKRGQSVMPGKSATSLLVKLASKDQRPYM